MRRWFVTWLIVALLLPRGVGAAGDWRGPVIGKAVAIAEIRDALARAEAVHPNLYWHAARADVSAREKALTAALPGDARPMDEYLILRELTGLLGDGHVQVSPPARPSGDLSGGGYLPLIVAARPGGLRVVRSATPEIVDGDILTRVNGRDAVQLFKRMMALEPGEPEFQRRQAEMEFSWLLWELGLHAPFTLAGTFAGHSGDVITQGVTQWNPFAAEPVGSASDNSLTVANTPGPIVVLTFRRMTDKPDTFWGILQDIFRTIAKRKPIGLIIDLRENTGGNSLLGDELLSFFNNKPYRPFAGETLKLSPECRKTFSPELFGSYAAVIRTMRDGEMHTWSIHATLPEPNPLRYNGPVAVLIGPGTFSSGNILANAIGDFHLAALVGRATAEIPNNYGMPCRIHLSHAGIALYVPSAFFVRANGNTANVDDVRPDIAVPVPSGDDGSDPDLAAARGWIVTQPRRAPALAGGR